MVKCWKINFLFLRLEETLLQNIEGWKICAVSCKEVVPATQVGPREKPLLSLQRHQHIFGKSNFLHCPSYKLYLGFCSKLFDQYDLYSSTFPRNIGCLSRGCKI